MTLLTKEKVVDVIGINVILSAGLDFVVPAKQVFKLEKKLVNIFALTQLLTITRSLCSGVRFSESRSKAASQSAVMFPSALTAIPTPVPAAARPEPRTPKSAATCIFVILIFYLVHIIF